MAEQQKVEAQNTVGERIENTTEELREIAHKLRLAARGVVNRLGENSNEFIDELVKAGEKLEKERQKSRKKSAGQEKSALVEARERLAGYLGLPTNEEVEKLNKKLNSLSRKVRKLEKEATGA